MKTTKILLTSFFMLIAGFSISNTIEDAAYFEGKWNVTVFGTPQGDATIPMRFETVDGVTTGYFIGDPSGVENTMDSVTITEGVLNAAFFIGGYDVTISLAKVDNDNSSGSMLGMFNLEGVRVAE